MHKVAYITDIHLAEEMPDGYHINCKHNLNFVLADLQKRGINKIVIGGDISDQKAHDWFFGRLKRETIRFYISPGNHDQSKVLAPRFDDYLILADGALVYTQTDENYKYIFLDSSKDLISDEQLNWFKKQLETNLKIVLFIHHPILNIPTVVDSLFPLANRSTVKTTLQELKQPVTVFCGHYHMDDIQTEGNITQIVTPAVSFQIDKTTPEISIHSHHFGYRIINFGETISHEIITFPKSYLQYFSDQQIVGMQPK